MVMKKNGHVLATDAAKLIGIKYHTLLRRVYRNNVKAVLDDGRIYIAHEEICRLKELQKHLSQIESLKLQ
jgi:phage antirepressor YoqD-like protein